MNSAAPPRARAGRRSGIAALAIAASLALLVTIVLGVRLRQQTLAVASFSLGGAATDSLVDALGRPFQHGSAALSGTAFALGFLLLGAWLAGQLFRLVGLPKVSGYLLFGLAVGPELHKVASLPFPALVTSEHLGYLKLVDALAISLIALMAGGEIRLSQLRSLARRVAILVGVDVPMVFAATFVGLLLLTPAVPFLDSMPRGVALVVCGLVAIFCVANSPAIVIAVLKETAAVGPLARTSLTMTVCKDLCLIALFTVALAIAAAVVGVDARAAAEAVQPGAEAAVGAAAAVATGAVATPSTAALVGEIAWHLGGSLVMGALIGAAMQLVGSRMGGRIDVFVIASGFLIAIIADGMHLAPLLVGLAAGFTKVNLFPDRSAPIFASIEHLSVPVYCVFFAVTGASIQLGSLLALWPVAMAIVALRLVATVVATRVAGRAAGVEPAVRTWLWTAMIPQAGVTIALALEVGRTFSAQPWGPTLASLLLAVVAVHELIGPPLMRLGLSRAGELPHDFR